MSVPSVDFSSWPPMASRVPVIDTMSAQHAGATVEGSIRINGAALPVGGVVCLIVPPTLTSGSLPLTVPLSTSSRPLPLRRLSVPCTSTIGAMLPAAWPTLAPLIRPYGPFSGGAAARLPQFTVPEIVARLSWLNSASGSVTFRSIVTKAFVRPDGGGGGGGSGGGAGGSTAAAPAAPHPVLSGSVHWLPSGTIGGGGVGFRLISGGGGVPMSRVPPPPPVIAFA